MKQFLLVLFVLLTSCEYVSSKKVSSQQIIEEELHAINWNDVDEYPTFVNCEGLNTTALKRSCFENYLTDLLNERLGQQNIVVTEDVFDTVQLQIHIDKTGEFSIREISMKSETQKQIPELDSLLRHCFDSLPKIHPAIKRSQQVATEFSLPVIININ